jgi:hypothetical protein
LFLAAVPLPAFAADPALSAWGAYLLFAIVATVVIVLLLHEALEDEPMDDRRRDERVGEAFGRGGYAQAARGAHDDSDNAATNQRVV